MTVLQKLAQETLWIIIKSPIHTRGRCTLREALPDEQKAAIKTLLSAADENSKAKYKTSLLYLINQYAVSDGDLAEIIPEKIPRSFSMSKYAELAPFFQLKPSRRALDMPNFDVYRSRLPPAVTTRVLASVDIAEICSGRISEHKTERARDRFVESIYQQVFALFDPRLKDQSEGLLHSLLTADGKIEHLFVGFGSVSSFFIEMKMDVAIEGAGLLHQHAQVMAEAAAVNYQNFQDGKWVPVLGVLCDGRLLRFYLYDSATVKGEPSFYCSRIIEGLPASDGAPMADKLEGIYRVAEYFFDFLVLSFINAMRAFLRASRGKTVLDGVTIRRNSTAQWEKAILMAEQAHIKLRMAARECDDEMAVDGVKMLEEAVSMSPDLSGKLKRKNLEECGRTYTRRKIVFGEED